MLEKIEELIRNPEQIRKCARINGVLSFDEECDEVKMERQSQIENKGESE